MALLVSGSSVGAGIYDISNDEGWSFQVYSSGTSMNIVGDDMDVNVWMTGVLANVQWMGRINSIWIDGGLGSTSYSGYTYPTSSGILSPETEIQFDEFASINGLGTFQSTSLAFVGGYLFFTDGDSISKMGILSGANNNDSIELPYGLTKFAVLNANTAYAEAFTGTYVDTNSFYKIDFVTRECTRLFSYVAEEVHGVDCNGYSDYLYSQLDGWSAISSYEDKKYYISACTATGSNDHIRLFIYDITNESLVYNQLIAVCSTSGISTYLGGGYNLTKPAFYEDKVAFSVYSWDAETCGTDPVLMEFPFPTIIFDMSTENVYRISPGTYSGVGEYFEMWGSGINKETGCYYLSIYDEHDRDTGIAKNNIWEIDLTGEYYNYAGPIFTTERGYPLQVINGRKSVHVIKWGGEAGLIYTPNGSYEGSLYNPYINFMEIFCDDSLNTIWGMNTIDLTPDVFGNTAVDGRYVYGYEIGDGDAIEDRTITLNHTSPVFHYEYERYCILTMLASNVCIIFLKSQQYDDTVPPYSAGLRQYELKIFKRPGT